QPLVHESRAFVRPFATDAPARIKKRRPRRAWHFGCNFHVRRDLVSRIVRHALAFGIAGAAGVALLAQGVVTGSQWISMSALVAPRMEPPGMEGAVVAPPHSEDADAIVDLYGNDVNSAVAEYSIDPLGSPYEVHSPQTELPRLASPKS